MLTPFDFSILLAASSGFAAFLLLHALLAHVFSRDYLSRTILLSIAAGFLIGETLFLFIVAASNSWGMKVIYAGISGVLYVLLVFHYVAWVFGMGEAAIRIRLLRILEARPDQKATLAEIKSEYDAATILKIRLERLVGSGHLALQGGRYSLQNHVILRQMQVTKFLRKLLGL